MGDVEGTEPATGVSGPSSISDLVDEGWMRCPWTGKQGVKGAERLVVCGGMIQMEAVNKSFRGRVKQRQIAQLDEGRGLEEMTHGVRDLVHVSKMGRVERNHGHIDLVWDAYVEMVKAL